jgi:hypothetical protein
MRPAPVHPPGITNVAAQLVPFIRTHLAPRIAPLLAALFTPLLTLVR